MTPTQKENTRRHIGRLALDVWGLSSSSSRSSPSVPLYKTQINQPATAPMRMSFHMCRLSRLQSSLFLNWQTAPQGLLLLSLWDFLFTVSTLHKELLRRSSGWINDLLLSALFTASHAHTEICPAGQRTFDFIWSRSSRGMRGIEAIHLSKFSQTKGRRNGKRKRDRRLTVINNERYKVRWKSKMICIIQLCPNI